MNHAPLVLSRRRLLSVGLIAILLLNVGNAVSIYLLHVRGVEFGLGIVPQFNFDREANLPTLFNGLLLAFGGLGAFAVSRWKRLEGSREIERRGWFGVGCVMVLMAVDEVCQIHEVVDWVLMKRIRTEGALAWPWVIPYALLAGAVALFFLKFFLTLGRRYQWLLAAASGLYVAGALGCEMLAADHSGEQGVESIGVAILYTIEENLEMIAAVIAAWAILTYAAKECDGSGFDVEVGS